MAEAVFGGTGPVVLSVPPGAVIGDVLLAQVGYDSGVSSPNVVAPQGWTLIRRDDYDVHFGQAIYYRVHNGAEPASYSWAPDGNPSAAGIMLAYRNVDGAFPLDADSAGAGDGVDLLAPQLTATGPSDVVVVFFGHDSSGATLTPGAPLVAITSSNAAETVMAAEMRLVAAGAAGPWTATATLANQWVAQAVALRAR